MNVGVKAAPRPKQVWTVRGISTGRPPAGGASGLFTEWHSRYGGRGVLVYWHVERG